MTRHVLTRPTLIFRKMCSTDEGSRNCRNVMSSEAIYSATAVYFPREVSRISVQILRISFKIYMFLSFVFFGLSQSILSSPILLHFHFPFSHSFAFFLIWILPSCCFTVRFLFMFFGQSFSFYFLSFLISLWKHWNFSLLSFLLFFIFITCFSS